MKKIVQLLFVALLLASGLVACSDDDSNSGSSATIKYTVVSDTSGYNFWDVHGAGAQRSDPKYDDGTDYTYGHGPQGDVRRIYLPVLLVRGDSTTSHSYQVVDTGQTTYFGTNTTLPGTPPSTNIFSGQDAGHSGLQPSYTDNGDGTVTDNNTGLMWTRSPDLNNDGSIDTNDKKLQADAVTYADALTTGGHTDWRLPSIKELYSLILFSGIDVSAYTGTDTNVCTPFMDTNYFVIAYGDMTNGDRLIDAQVATSTIYVSTTMGGGSTMFGVNFIDGRIKGYPTENKSYYVYCVRGNTSYGVNSFQDNGDGTISDSATGLMWTQSDNGAGLNWQEALEYVQTKNSENYLGHSDWRLPNVKELQSIVDYTRSPDTTGSPAINALFNLSTCQVEDGSVNWGFYWTGTTHKSYDQTVGYTAGNACYVSFGEAFGWMAD